MKNADLFDLTGKVAVITGGAGLLGRQHAEAIAGAGGIPVLADIPAGKPKDAAAELSKKLGSRVAGYEVDITNPADIERMRDALAKEFGGVDILINNAANNPKVESATAAHFSRLENFPFDTWTQDL